MGNSSKGQWGRVLIKTKPPLISLHVERKGMQGGLCVLVLAEINLRNRTCRLSLNRPCKCLVLESVLRKQQY